MGRASKPESRLSSCTDGSIGAVDDVKMVDPISEAQRGDVQSCKGRAMK